MDPYQILVYIHILLFVFWLGADTGVFLLAQKVKDASLTFGERAICLKMAMIIDILPRICFILMPAVGLTMAAQNGISDITGTWLILVWLIALAWLFLAMATLAAEGKPYHPLMRRSLSIWLVIAGLFFVGTAIAALLGIGPYYEIWFILKVLLYGLIFVCSIMIDVSFSPMIPAFAALGEHGSTPDIERDIRKAINGASFWVLILYGLLIVIGFLGTTKIWFG